MKHVWFAALAFVLVASLGGAADKDDVKVKVVKHEVFSSYFEKNDSGLKGNTSFLVLKSSEEFDKLFGVAAVGTKKPSVLPKGAFEETWWSRSSAAATRPGDIAAKSHGERWDPHSRVQGDRGEAGCGHLRVAAGRLRAQR